MFKVLSFAIAAAIALSSMTAAYARTPSARHSGVRTESPNLVQPFYPGERSWFDRATGNVNTE